MTGPVTAALQAADEPTIRLEHHAAQQVTASLRRQLQHAAQQITRLYIRFAGSIDQPLPQAARRLFANACSDLIAQVTVNIRGPLRAIVDAALQTGQDQARPYLPAGAAVAELTPSALQWTQQLVGSVDDRIRAQLLSAQARPQIDRPLDYRDIVDIVAHAYRALSLAERDTRWSVNNAINTGVRHVTDQAGLPRMWVAERDACLHCLAYSGQIAQPGESYPTGLTFYIDPKGNYKPLSYETVWGPTLHPNCRCRERPYLGLSADYPIMGWENRAFDPSEALKREARRSVVRGQSGSDSLPARLRATGVLLQRGAGLPKSVVERGRAAVVAGRYGR